MNVRSGAVLLIPALGLVVPAACSAQTPSKSPAATPAPVVAAPVAAAPARAEKRTVDVDLAAGGRGESFALTAPRGEHFWVVLKNRAPGGKYRVTYDWMIDPATPSRPPAGALHKEYELFNLGPQPRFAVSAACEEVQNRAEEVWNARDERAAHEALVAFRAKSAGTCERLAHFTTVVNMAVDSELVPVHTLYDGDELRYVVERFDPATKAALKTWRFTVRPQTLGLTWAYASEEEWIVGEVSCDIVEMILFAKDHALPAAKALSLSVRAEGPPGPTPRYTIAYTPRTDLAQKQVLGFDGSIWSPESYQPLAVGLLQALKLGSAPASPEGTVGAAIAYPTSRALVQESDKVSKRLQQAMLDAGAHEQAALLVGSLALREAAGPFTDVRPALSRMSAHLALARALRRGTASPTAAYADVLLLTLVNRQRDALARIDSLERARPAAPWAAFLRALRIRITRDWRILSAPAQATLVERLQHYRALRQSLGSSQALAFLESFKPEPIGDWGRVALQSGGSLEEGQLFAKPLPGIDMKDAAEVWALLQGGPLPAAKVAEALNALPQGLVSRDEKAGPVPRVIGWGTWARYFQRALAFDTHASTDFLESVLGLPDEARQWRAGLDQKLSGLELWPILTAESSVPAEEAPGTPAAAIREKACAQAVALTQTAPERVMAGSWFVLDQKCSEAKQDQSLPQMSRWMRTLTPAGTALMPRERTVLVPQLKLDGRKLFAGLHELAPFEPVFLDALTSPYQAPLPVADLAALYGPLADYDLAAMTQLAMARRGEPAAVSTLYAKMVAIDPDKYNDLGHILVDEGRDDEAAAAYEKAIEKSRDRIGVSYSTYWLVGYYLDHARVQRAREVAQIGADVYSATGLEAMAYFLERTGKYVEAEEAYKKIIERYGEDSRGSLDDFYIRHEQRVGDGRFAKEARAAMARVFPSGLERVSISDLTAPPDPGEGARVSGKHQNTLRFGMQVGDQVVAINGYRLRNEAQWGLLWSLDDKPEGTTIVWRQGRYVEVRGRLKRMNYGPATRPA